MTSRVWRAASSLQACAEFCEHFRISNTLLAGGHKAVDIVGRDGKAGRNALQSHSRPLVRNIRERQVREITMYVVAGLAVDHRTFRATHTLEHRHEALQVVVCKNQGFEI